MRTTDERVTMLRLINSKREQNAQLSIFDNDEYWKYDAMWNAINHKGNDSTLKMQHFRTKTLKLAQKKRFSGWKRR